MRLRYELRACGVSPRSEQSESDQQRRAKGRAGAKPNGIAPYEGDQLPRTGRWLDRNDARNGWVWVSNGLALAGFIDAGRDRRLKRMTAERTQYNAVRQSDASLAAWTDACGLDFSTPFSGRSDAIG